jgi:hypothetical protein
MTEQINKKLACRYKILQNKNRRNFGGSCKDIYNQGFSPLIYNLDGEKSVYRFRQFTDGGFHLHHNHILLKGQNIATLFIQNFPCWWEKCPLIIWMTQLKNLRSLSVKYIRMVIRYCFLRKPMVNHFNLGDFKARETLHYAHYRFTSEEMQGRYRQDICRVKVYGIMILSV